MSEIDIAIGRQLWWTQNRRSRSWAVPYRRKKQVKTMSLLTFRKPHQQWQAPKARALAGARDRHHPPIDPRTLRPRERGANGQGDTRWHHPVRLLARR